MKIVRLGASVLRHLVVLSGLGIGGCSGDIGASEQLGAQTSPVIYSPSHLWQLVDFPLEVCFQSTGDGTPEQRQAVHDYVTAEWEGLPGSAVAFTGWETCADDRNSGDIRIFLDSSVNRDNSLIGTTLHQPGRVMNLGTDASRRSPKYGDVHEFGHALGLEHEQINPENRCYGVSHSGVYSDDLIASRYDDGAIMDYCSHYPEHPSALEQMFTRVAYPSADAFSGSGQHLPVMCRGCFTRPPGISDGQVDTILRADGVLQDAFSAAGMLPWWDAGDSQLRWFGTRTSTLDLFQNPFPFVSAQNGDMPGSAFTPGDTYKLIYTATMKINGGSVTGSTTVQVDSAKWTAIANTVL